MASSQSQSSTFQAAISTDGSNLQFDQHRFPIMAPPCSMSMRDFISFNRLFPLLSERKEAVWKGTPRKTWVATLDEFERRDQSTRSAVLDACDQGSEEAMKAWRSLMKDVPRQSIFNFFADGSAVTGNLYSDDNEGQASKYLGRVSWSLGEVALCTAQISDYLGRGGTSSKTITEQLDRRSSLLRVSNMASDAVKRQHHTLKLWRFVIHHEHLPLKENEVQSANCLEIQASAQAGDDVDQETLEKLAESERMFSATLSELSQKWIRMMPSLVVDVQSVREFFEPFHETLSQLNAQHIDELQFWESANPSTSGSKAGSSRKKASALFKAIKSKLPGGVNPALEASSKRVPGWEELESRDFEVTVVPYQRQSGA
jgi:hypothetical protein